LINNYGKNSRFWRSRSLSRAWRESTLKPWRPPIPSSRPNGRWTRSSKSSSITTTIWERRRSNWIFTKGSRRAKEDHRLLIIGFKVVKNSYPTIQRSLRSSRKHKKLARTKYPKPTTRKKALRCLFASSSSRSSSGSTKCMSRAALQTSLKEN